MRIYYDYCRRCDGNDFPYRGKLGGIKNIIKRFTALRKALASSGTIGVMEQLFNEALIKVYRLPCDEGLDEDIVQFECVKRMRDEIELFLRSRGTSAMSERTAYIRQLLRIGELRDNIRLTKLHGSPPTNVNCLKRVPRRMLITWIRKLLEDGYIKLHEIDPPPLLDLYDYGFHGDGKSHMKIEKQSHRKFSWRKSITGCSAKYPK